MLKLIIKVLEISIKAHWIVQSPLLKASYCSIDSVIQKQIKFKLSYSDKIAVDRTKTF